MGWIWLCNTIQPSLAMRPLSSRCGSPAIVGIIMISCMGMARILFVATPICKNVSTSCVTVSSLSKYSDRFCAYPISQRFVLVVFFSGVHAATETTFRISFRVGSHGEATMVLTPFLNFMHYLGSWRREGGLL